MIDFLEHTGVGASYKSTLEHVSLIAGEVQKNIANNKGVYVPPGLRKNQTIYAAIDNIDAKVDTPDGKESFHALAATVFQKDAEQGATSEPIISPLQFDVKPSTMKLTNVPLTGVELLPCSIVGTPRPKTSPYYPEFKVFQHTDKLVESEQCINAWLLGQFFCRQATLTDTQSVEHVVTTEAASVISNDPDVLEMPSSLSQSSNSTVTDAQTEEQIVTREVSP